MPSEPSTPGKIALAFGQTLPLTVLHSRAGHYLGTQTLDGQPYSRESVQYWPDAEKAAAALDKGLWTQRREP